MWTCQRILQISWTDDIFNVKVMQRIKKGTEVVFTVKKQKLEYFGHIMRYDKYRLLQLTIQDKVNSKKGWGRGQTFLDAQPAPTVCTIISWTIQKCRQENKSSPNSSQWFEEKLVPNFNWLMLTDEAGFSKISDIERSETNR